jgi:hypothetical protein
MAVSSLPLPPPQVPLFNPDGKPTQQGFEFLDRLQSLVKQINASLATLSYAPTSAQYVTMAAEATLTVERILAVSAALSLVDGGAGNNVTIGRAALTGDATAPADSNAVTLVKASSAFSLTGIISPAQLTANQNDYAPTGIATANIVRLTTDATARNLTGLNASQADGRWLWLMNVNAVGGANVTTTAQDVASSAANRFISAATIQAGSCRGCWYDGTTARWRYGPT